MQSHPCPAPSTWVSAAAVSLGTYLARLYRPSIMQCAICSSAAADAVGGESSCTYCWQQELLRWVNHVGRGQVGSTCLLYATRASKWTQEGSTDYKDTLAITVIDRQWCPKRPSRSLKMVNISTILRIYSLSSSFVSSCPASCPFHVSILHFVSCFSPSFLLHHRRNHQKDTRRESWQETRCGEENLRSWRYIHIHSNETRRENTCGSG